MQDNIPLLITMQCNHAVAKSEIRNQYETDPSNTKLEPPTTHLLTDFLVRLGPTLLLIRRGLGHHFWEVGRYEILATRQLAYTL
jgi:hypothetical protein